MHGLSMNVLYSEKLPGHVWSDEPLSCRLESCVWDFSSQAALLEEASIGDMGQWVTPGRQTKRCKLSDVLVPSETTS